MKKLIATFACALIAASTAFAGEYPDVSIKKLQELIEATLSFIRQLPEALTAPAHFYFDHLDELSLDVRAHDHLDPVNKRTNYMFGEWDPETIDSKGFYRRFVVRRVILDSLLRWISTNTDIPKPERLFDAAAVLAGLDEHVVPLRPPARVTLVAGVLLVGDGVAPGDEVVGHPRLVQRHLP